jgi:hypothetical protein
MGCSDEAPDIVHRSAPDRFHGDHDDRRKPGSISKAVPPLSEIDLALARRFL